MYRRRGVAKVHDRRAATLSAHGGYQAFMRFRKLSPVLLGCALALSIAAPASAYAPFEMGIHDPFADNGDAARFDRIKDANAGVARITMYWARHVPGGSDKPAGFDARNPADPGYNWTAVDAFVKAADARGMEALITTLEAPPWAEGYTAADRARRFGDAGTYHPNPKDFADFMHALATRYSGKFKDAAGNPLPRVRYWQMWNEPNFGQYLTSKRASEIPFYYLRLLNAGHDAVKGVYRSNQVLTAGLGPYGNNGHATDVEPQFFMRSIMCLTGAGGKNLRDKPRCKTPKPKFDIWTQHPYTFGGTPRTQAGHADSAAMGDMVEVKRTLDFAARSGNLAGTRRKKLWISEMGWFSNPPGIVAGDGRQLGLPLDRQAAYLSETAYRVWKLGFSGFIWYGLDDQDGFPTGLFLGKLPDAQPKPALAAFKLPFYADASRGRVLVWGKVNGAGKSRVLIEKRSGSTWKRVVELSTDSRGVFYDRVRGSRGTYRAQAVTGAAKGTIAHAFRAR
jgi:hypothetical protein